jgi:hypothetical protein
VLGPGGDGGGGVGRIDGGGERTRSASSSFDGEAATTVIAFNVRAAEVDERSY